jgi:phosphate:Na+ symporter
VLPGGRAGDLENSAGWATTRTADGAAVLNAWFAVAGGLGLFLLGMTVMTRGLREAAGESLARVLARFTRSPTSGAATGAVVTAVVQSSSATTVAAVGFVAAGLLTFGQALGVVLGANAGTTATGWIVAVLGFKVDLGAVAPPLVLAGMLGHFFLRGRARALGLALAGFALIFVAIDVLRDGLSGLGDVVRPEALPDDTPVGRLALVGLGIAITVVTQSSSAGVAMALTALHGGLLTLGQAAALVVGMDVGTTATAALATVGASVAARRTGLAHVVFNLLTGVMAYLLLQPYGELARRVGLAAEPELALVAFHTGFNVLGVLLVLPVAGRLRALVERLVPERGPPLTRRLDEAALVDPTLGLHAVAGALREIAGHALAAAADLVRRAAPPAESARALAGAGEALSEARRYLARIESERGRPESRAAHAALMHALDHVGRLIDRTSRSAPPPSVHAERDIASVTGELAASMEAPIGSGPDALARQAALATRLREGEGGWRSRVIAGAAHGNLAEDEALEQLNELRRLRRLAYHAWRIRQHLAEAAGEVNADAGAEGADAVASPRSAPASP